MKCETWKKHSLDRTDRGWQLLGSVGVDSGEIVISDPCYLNEPKYGLLMMAGYGDGIYPVYAKCDEMGYATEVRIMFNRKPPTELPAE